MFKKRVIDWKLQKNYKAAEREAVARVVKQYKNHGNPIPTILLSGQPVKMHRIQRHCNIGQSITGTFESAGSFDSNVIENDARQIQPRGLPMKYNKDMYLMDDMRTSLDNLPNIATLFARPFRHLSPPDELKHAEIVIFQTNTFYERFAQSEVTPEMKGNIAQVSEAEIQARMAGNPDAFESKFSAALSSLNSSQSNAGWRLLHEAMNMIKPMLAGKHPYNLEAFITWDSEWEDLLPPDLHRAIWGQISEMACIVLGESDPLSKVCLAITHIKSKIQVLEIVLRLMRSIFERTLGPYELKTLRMKSRHAISLLANGDFAGAECLQRMVISDSEELNEFERRKEIVDQFYQLGYILRQKREFTSAKKVFHDALHLSRLANWEQFPTPRDIHWIKALVPTLSEDEYIEGEVLLQEALEKCLTYERWGRCDWRTVLILGLLENLLRKQEKFHEAEMLRLQYPEAF